MVQKGQLDASIGMQLLGAAAAGLIPDNKKRPRDETTHASSVDGEKPGESGGDPANDPDAPSLDEVLNAAKRAKNDTNLQSIVMIFF